MATPLWSFVSILGLLAASPCVTLPAAQGLAGGPLRTALTDTAADFWVYDDLASATKQARAAGKPLLVSFRCVP